MTVSLTPLVNGTIASADDVMASLNALNDGLNTLGATTQPLDADLTAIAGLATTATGRSLLAAANAGALQAILALGTAATHATGDYDASGAAAAVLAASPAGQRPPSGPETNLEFIRGIVNADGTIAEGAGFTITKLGGLGHYRINFTAAFSDNPAVVASASAEAHIATVLAVTPGSDEVTTCLPNSTLDDSGFHFQAIGPV